MQLISSLVEVFLPQNSCHSFPKHSDKSLRKKVSKFIKKLRQLNLLWPWNHNLTVLFFSYCSQLSPVAQKANDAIHRINLYPLDTQLFPWYLTASPTGLLESAVVYPCLIPRCLSLSMKICAQRNARRSKRARRASPLFFLRPMVPCALSPVLAFCGHLWMKNEAPVVNAILKHSQNLIICNLFLSSPQWCAASAKCQSRKLFCNCGPLVSPIAEGSGRPSRRLRGILSEGRRPW